MSESPQEYFLGRVRFGVLKISLMSLGLLVLTACSKPLPAPEVSANGEILQGAWVGEKDEIAVFRGIPFAAPPVGELRWRKPVDNNPREGFQQVTEFAPACMQGQHIVNWHARVAAAFGHGPEVVGQPRGVSEDCLYLNIWTPDVSPTRQLPVMVFVHGGSNKGGWSYEPNYLGDRLAARGVVLVSIAYRLGPLGFFSHPALDNGPGEPVANFGLLDIEQAFRWIKNNISEFGGDPDNITGFGESAGAGNLLVLALAGLDYGGLFRRVIAQSTGGSMDGLGSLADEQLVGKTLLEGLGIGADASRSQLQAIPAGELVDAVDTLLPGHYFSPVIDGLILEKQPLEAVLDGRGGKLDLLIGTNADEWLMYIDPASDQASIEQWVKNTAPEFAGSLLSLVENESDPRRALDRLQTARDTLCPSRHIAATISAQGGQGFVYYFTRQRSGEGGDTLGVYHGTELPYVFNQHDEWLPTEESDKILTAAVMDYWVSFSHNGSPTASRQPGWPIYTASRQYVMELGEPIRIIEPHDNALCRYLGPRKNHK